MLNTIILLDTIENKTFLMYNKQQFHAQHRRSDVSIQNEIYQTNL